MEMHEIFTHMLKKKMISLDEMITIVVIGEEIQNRLVSCFGNGAKVDSLFNADKNMVITLDVRSMSRKSKRLEKKNAKDIILPLMTRELPLDKKRHANEVIIKEMKCSNERLELVISNAFLPLLAGKKLMTKLAAMGYCKVPTDDGGIKKQ